MERIFSEETFNLRKLGNNSILCSISTRGRYDTTLPLAIQSVVMQELLPDALVIFDDNDNPSDIRTMQHYEYLLRILDEKKIRWSVLFGEKRGQHFNHQKANNMGYKYVWRIDDDCIAEPDVLKKLYAEMKDDIGAVGGSILTPPHIKGIKATGKIENINSEPNMQWGRIKETMEVDHLHCSYLYRAGIFDFDLSLSRIAHREETLHTYGIKKKGYRILVTDCVTWHLKNKFGGIRDGQEQMFDHDEKIFKGMLNLCNVKSKSDKKIIIADAGIGDHYALKSILPQLRLKHEKLILAVCYPDVFFDEDGLNLISIADAKNLFGSIEEFSIYKWMDDNKWKQSLSEAFLKMYS